MKGASPEKEGTDLGEGCLTGGEHKLTKKLHLRGTLF